MPKLTESTLRSCNGKTDLYVREWTPNGAVRGVVQISHGVAEHIERYDDFARFLAENGFAVAGNDHLGHGRSAAGEDDLGYFGKTGGWELVVGDMHAIYRQTSANYPSLPYFLFGHSMGSFLARTYIIRYRTKLGGVILSGTGQQSPVLVTAGSTMAKLEIRRHGPEWHSQMLNDLAFGKYNDGFSPARTPKDWLSRDNNIVDKYIADPLCGYVPTAGLFRDMMGGIAYISKPKNLSRMDKDLPVYFISGNADPVGENGKGVMRAYQSFLDSGMSDVTMKLYHGGRHEMLNELNRDEVYSDILAWLTGKLN